MLLPDQERYDEKKYLRDALRAQKEYWIDEKRTYWPEYHGEKVSTWEEIRPFVWFFCVVILFIAACALIAYQPHHIQIIQPKVHGPIPSYVTPTT